MNFVFVNIRLSVYLFKYLICYFESSADKKNDFPNGCWVNV